MYKVPKKTHWRSINTFAFKWDCYVEWGACDVRRRRGVSPDWGQGRPGYCRVTDLPKKMVTSMNLKIKLWYLRPLPDKISEILISDSVEWGYVKNCFTSDLIVSVCKTIKIYNMKNILTTIHTLSMLLKSFIDYYLRQMHLEPKDVSQYNFFHCPILFILPAYREIASIRRSYA